MSTTDICKPLEKSYFALPQMIAALIYFKEFMRAGAFIEQKRTFRRGSHKGRPHAI